MSIAGRHSVANAVARTPLHTLPAQPARRPGAADRARRWMFAAAVALVLAGSFGVGGFVQQQKAKALIPVTDIFCVTCYLNRLLDEADQITVDQVRKIVIKEITKKVIEKIIYGNNGGVGIGGALGTSGNAAAAFINDYAQYLYIASADDTRRYVDQAYDRYFPSYIDPSIKTSVKNRYDPNFSFVPSDCIDPNTIQFGTDPNALDKLQKSLQPGCTTLSASILLGSLAQDKYDQIVKASQTEAQANAGLVSKDEKTNKLKQSGVVYQGIVQGAIEAVYQVQTNSQSAVSQIIGALVDQVIDQILSNEAK